MSQLYAIITSIGGRGYHCIEHSSQIGEETISKLEEKALPYGSEWNRFIGVRSIKGFRINPNMFVISYVSVTDKRDDCGRTGILSAHCNIMDFNEYKALLTEQGFGYSIMVGQMAKLEGRNIKRSKQKAVKSSKTFQNTTNAMIRLCFGRKHIISRRYINPEQWQEVETLIRHILLSLPNMLLSHTSFVTFALSKSDPSSIIALPI